MSALVSLLRATSSAQRPNQAARQPVSTTPVRVQIRVVDRHLQPRTCRRRNEVADQLWYDEEEVDQMILALLYLTLHDGMRAWKGFDFDALDRLSEKGLIENPKNTSKSIVFTEQGLTRARALFATHFGMPAQRERE